MSHFVLYILQFSRISATAIVGLNEYGGDFTPKLVRQWQWFYVIMEILFRVQIHNIKWISMSQFNRVIFKQGTRCAHLLTQIDRFIWFKGILYGTTSRALPFYIRLRPNLSWSVIEWLVNIFRCRYHHLLKWYIYFVKKNCLAEPQRSSMSAISVGGPCISVLVNKSLNVSVYVRLYNNNFCIVTVHHRT